MNTKKLKIRVKMNQEHKETMNYSEAKIKNTKKTRNYGKAEIKNTNKTIVS
jgi:hypothetical protein